MLVTVNVCTEGGGEREESSIKNHEWQSWQVTRPALGSLGIYTRLVAMNELIFPHFSHFNQEKNDGKRVR